MSVCPPSDISYSKDPASETYFLKPYSVTPAFTTLPPSNNIIRSDASVDSTALDNWVKTLVRTTANPPTTIEPNNSANPTQDYAGKAATLRKNIKAEYCYYYSRYIWALETVLTNATSRGAVVDPILKDGAQALNMKLNTILLVMKGLINSRNSVLGTYYEDPRKGVNSLNADLDKARGNLSKHSQILQNNDLQADIQSAMIDYSLEKNSSSRNLLAVYGFLNIVAAGLLFYVYTNTKA